MLGAWLALALSSAVAGEDSLDLLEVSYLKRTSRAAEAIAIVTPWLAAHPDDARAWMTWIDLHAQSWTRDPVLLSATTRAWAEAHPDAPLRHAVAAEALAVAAIKPGLIRFGDEFRPDASGPWCAEAQTAVRELPRAPLDRVTVYDQQRRFAKACGWSETAYLTESGALATSGEAGPWAKVWMGVADGVTRDDVADAQALLDSSVWYRISDLRWLKPAGWTGDGASEVRSVVHARADTLADSARPAELWVAMEVYRALDDDELARQVGRRLRRLDDRARGVTAWIDGVSHLQEVAASTVIDPAERLKVLRRAAQRIGASAWERCRHLTVVADTAASAHDASELRVRSRAWHVCPDAGSNLRFAALAVTRDVRLREASRAVDIAVDALVFEAQAADVNLESDDDRVVWAREAAQALDVRARVSLARGDVWDARDDLIAAARIEPDDAERMVRIGLIDADGDNPIEARHLLGAALRRGLDEPLATQARQALADVLLASGLRVTVDAYVAELPDPRVEPTASVGDWRTPGAGEPFPDLPLTVDGAVQALASIDGPIVIDLWATWCGPCKQSLPHLEALAKAHEGRVTVIAASVDESAALASHYLAAQGDLHFMNAWVGDAAQDALGFEGIPQIYVLDAAHRIVFHADGYSTDTRSFDGAVEAVAAGR